MTEQQKTQIAKLRQNGDSYKKIADTLGLSVNTIKSFCRNNGLTGKVTPPKADVCLVCGKTLVQTAKRKKRKFCSAKCREKWWNNNRHVGQRRTAIIMKCMHCSREFIAYPREHRKYCSCECYISDRFHGGHHHVG